MKMPTIKFQRPDVERYSRDAMPEGIKLSYDPMAFVPPELREHLPYRGKRMHEVVLELVGWIKQLEAELELERLEKADYKYSYVSYCQLIAVIGAVIVLFLAIGKVG